jgi:Flp pilus assembly protein TadG
MNARLMRSDRGTSIIEFALVAPVLIFLVIGLIEIGRYTYFGILASHAARAAAQYGDQTLVTADDVAGMKAAALQDAQSLPQWNVSPAPMCTQSGAVFTCASGTPPPGTTYYVKVQVTGTFSPLLHYPGIPTSLPVSATAILRVIKQ